MITFLTGLELAISAIILAVLESIGVIDRGPGTLELHTVDFIEFLPEGSGIIALVVTRYDYIR